MYNFGFDVRIEVFILNVTNPHRGLNVHVRIISALHTSGIVQGDGLDADLVRKLGLQVDCGCIWGNEEVVR